MREAAKGFLKKMAVGRGGPERCVARGGEIKAEKI